jgi:hypothetical protein
MSAVVFLILPVVHFFVNSKIQKEVKIILGIALLAISIFIFPFVWECLPASYRGFFENPSWRSGNRLFFMARIMLLGVVCFIHTHPLKKYITIKRHKDESEAIWMLSVLNVLLTIPLLPSPLSRIADFFTGFLIILMYKNVRIRREYRSMVIFATGIILAIYFLGVQFMFNYNGMREYGVVFL